MRLPHSFFHSTFFQFSNLAELSKALEGNVSVPELDEVARLAHLGLPPLSSNLVLAAMLGINPGLVWSFEQKPSKHYRRFEIPKGKGTRVIHAPRVGLKIIQKWLSVQFQLAFAPPSHVFGFVPGKSHVHAAAEHVNATWVYSVDIRDFFQTTPAALVVSCLIALGYSQESAEFISRLTCLEGFLAQGSPSSPVLSNLCFQQFDARIAAIAADSDIRLTRYADDIVFSGAGAFPQALPHAVADIFSMDSPWALADKKTELALSPERLKVHGLLVNGPRVRLTKGYRNRLRSYRQLLATGRVRGEDLRKVRGHVAYGDFVENF